MAKILMQATNDVASHPPLPYLRTSLIVAAAQVYGMRNKSDNFPVKLGGGKYDLKGRPIQTFAIA